MKRLIYIISVCLAVLCTVPQVASAQARLTTRKVKLADFSTRTTRVVLTGDTVTDELLKNEVSRRWRISPYEFCSVSEFESGRWTTGYYYLVILQEYSKDQRPGICTLGMIKGGKKKTSNPDEKGFEVVSVPFSSGGACSGREVGIMPVAIDLIQNFIMGAMSSERVAYTGLSASITGGAGKNGRQIFIADTDVAEGVSPDEEGNISVVSEEELEEVLSSGTPGTSAGYAVAPEEPQNGDVCYKMVFSADTHELYYFRKHRISHSSGAGFLAVDLERLR